MAIAEDPAKPRAREQKSQDEALNTGTRRPRGSREGSWEGHRPEQPILPAPHHPKLAASLRLQPSEHPDTHPNTAWETEIDPPVGSNCSNPEKATKSAKYLPSPVAQNSLGLKTGLDGGRRGRSGGGAQDPVSPLTDVHPYTRWKSGNWPHSGHFSQLGSLSLRP